MKRLLLLVIIAGVVLGLILPRPGLSLEHDHHWLPVLAAVLESGGARVVEYDLEGWATLQGSAEPELVISRLQGKLGLTQEALITGRTTWGQAWQKSGVNSDGAVVQFLIQNDGRYQSPHRSYCVIRCRLSAGNRSDQACSHWEQRLRGILQQLGRDHRLYLTVRGVIPRQVGRQAEQALGRSLFHLLGGRVTGSQDTEQYQSLTGYSPLLPDVVNTGNSEVNINIAFVGRKDVSGTQIYFGVPVITAEY